MQITTNDRGDRAGVHLVTGAFGYSGSYIARELLRDGKRVRTLTSRSGAGSDLADLVDRRPLDFSQPEELAASMEGASVLYNTYWVRFSEAGFSQADAVENTKTLFRLAREAGVKRIVHVSITKPAVDSPYEYFRCKAEMEQALADCGVPYSVLRPAVLFGGDDILINNMAWVLRRLPVVGVFGSGKYGMQPIHVEDFARLAVRAGRAKGNEIVQAVGSEVWSYRDLLGALAKAMGLRRWITSVPTSVGLLASACIGKLQGDVTLTQEEVGALMDGLLAVDSPGSLAERAKDGALQNPLGQWMRANANSLGQTYANELGRR